MLEHAGKVDRGTSDAFVSINDKCVYLNLGGISNIAPFPTPINPAVQ